MGIQPHIEKPRPRAGLFVFEAIILTGLGKVQDLPCLAYRKRLKMRQIQTNREMNLIKLEGKGFVFNERPEVRRVHHVTCEAVTHMGTKHPKYYSEDRARSRVWLDRRFGADGWINCGICRGLNSTSN